MDLGIANKRILVTGASRGIGLAIADTFLQEGARVMLLARTQSALQEAAGRLLCALVGVFFDVREAVVHAGRQGG